MGFAEYGDYDGLGLAELVKNKDVKPSEIIDETISRAEALNPKLNFLIHKGYDQARELADSAELPDGPFKGVPWLVKELATAWEGMPMTNSSPYMKDLVAPFDSETLVRIKAGGMIPMGKSNAPELGWCLATEPKLYGACLNPYDPAYTPGGSSGGSAAAVAARVLPIAEGSDGGGSIRVPSSHCNIFGLKPARGRISLAPALADFWYGGALFHCMSRTVRDTAAFMDMTYGHLPGEPYQVAPPPRPYSEEVGVSPGKLKIAMVTDVPDGCGPLHPDVKKAVEDCGKLMESLGHIVEPQPIPYDFWSFYKVYTDMTAATTASWLDAMAGFVGREATWQDMEPLYWTMVYKGRSFSAQDHANHIEGIRQMSRDMLMKMNAYDTWLMPVMPTHARPIGHYDMSLHVDEYDQTKMGPDCAYSAPFNASGSPAMSVPFSMSEGGLPIGVQFVGRDLDETTLIRIASQIEEARPWADNKPAICA
jgi:amidase